MMPALRGSTLNEPTTVETYNYLRAHLSPAFSTEKTQEVLRLVQELSSDLGPNIYWKPLMDSLIKFGFLPQAAITARLLWNIQRLEQERILSAVDPDREDKDSNPLTNQDYLVTRMRETALLPFELNLLDGTAELTLWGDNLVEISVFEGDNRKTGFLPFNIRIETYLEQLQSKTVADIIDMLQGHEYIKLNTWDHKEFRFIPSIASVKVLIIIDNVHYHLIVDAFKLRSLGIQSFEQFEKFVTLNSRQGIINTLRKDLIES